MSDDLKFSAREDWGWGEHVMTLRDYFAMQALEGMLAGMERRSSWSSEGWLAESRRIAGAAYMVADAMLKARTT